ncbi:HEAT repeat domain-containing protein [bacterium]|nr:HEAT repeat domain-containing protein [bacterium]
MGMASATGAEAPKAPPPKAPASRLSPDEYRRLRAVCFRLGENEPGKKWDAARQLIHEGAKAVPVVAEILDGDWLEGKQVATWILSEIHHPSAVGPLARALNDKDEEVHWKAAVGLKRIGRPSVFALMAVLLNGELHAKQCAAWTLGEIGDPAASGALAAALEEADEDLRWKAAISVSQIGQQALPALTVPLAKGTVETRRCAVWAAGQIGTHASLTALEQALKDKDNHVRAKAVVALGNIPGDASTALLLRMVKDPDAVVRKDAIVALGRRGKTLDPAARVEKRDAEPSLEVASYQAFTLTYKPKTPPAVKNLFADAKLSASFVSPDDRTIRVRGHYVGKNTWTVRTTLDEPGNWYYRMDFRLGKATDTTHGSVKCVEGKFHGFLRIDKTHRRFLVHDDGTRFYPIGTGTETLGRPGDQAKPINTLAVWKAYLDDCAKGGMNKSRILLNELPWVKPAVAAQHPELSPWVIDAAGRYDLTRFSLPFWDKLDAVIAHGAQRGIVFELSLFDETGLARGQDEGWALHPFNHANGGPLHGLSGSPDFYDLSHVVSRGAQERFVAYLLARTAGCPNVYYELNTQMNRRGTAGRLGPRWAEHWAGFFREHDPFDHLVSIHVVQDVTGYYLIDGIDIANMHGDKVPEPTGIHMPTFLSAPFARDRVAERSLFWQALLLGSGSARAPWQGLTERTAAFDHLPHLASYAASVNYWEFQRDRETVLATPGGTQALAVARKDEVVVYLTGASQGGTVRVGLRTGRYDVSWYDPKTGNTVRVEEIQPRQGAAELTCPTFDEDIVLRIRRK